MRERPQPKTDSGSRASTRCCTPITARALGSGDGTWSRSCQIRAEQPPAALAGATLWIDTFNVLTTVEVALSGGVVMSGCDGFMRDIAGVHRSHRRLEDAEPAVALLACTLAALEVSRCDWLLDAPVANSGRLCALLDSHAERGWSARVVADPDPLLANAHAVVATADGAVLDAAERSCNLARLCVERELPAAFAIDLGHCASQT